MNAHEITSLISDHCKLFKGVYAANEIFIVKPPAFIIVNTDEKGGNGKHWIAMFLNKERCEFFDSFGRSPTFYHQYWENNFKRFSKDYVYNSIVLQEPSSDDCGKFCIYYCILRNLGVSFECIVDKEINLDNFLSCLTVTGTALKCV